MNEIKLIACLAVELHQIFEGVMAVGDFLISVPQITAVSEAIPEKIWSRN
jgi:hypothetical protein